MEWLKALFHVSDFSIANERKKKKPPTWVEFNVRCTWWKFRLILAGWKGSKEDDADDWWKNAPTKIVIDSCMDFLKSQAYDLMPATTLFETSNDAKICSCWKKTLTREKQYTVMEWLHSRLLHDVFILFSRSDVHSMGSRFVQNTN